MRKALFTPFTDTATGERSSALARASAGLGTVAVNSGRNASSGLDRHLAYIAVDAGPLDQHVRRGRTVVGAADPGVAAVCIPTYGAYDVFTQCLHSVLEHTPPEVRVLVADDASEDPAIGRLVEEVNAVRPPRSAVGYVRRERNAGSCTT